MPIYEYECQKCGHRFQVRQKFSDDPIKTCQRNGCRGRVRKVLSAPAVIYKCSGFYTTDYGRADGNGNGRSKSHSRSESSSDSKTTEKASSGSKDEE